MSETTLAFVDPTEEPPAAPQPVAFRPQPMIASFQPPPGASGIASFQPPKGAATFVPPAPSVAPAASATHPDGVPQAEATALTEAFARRRSATAPLVMPEPELDVQIPLAHRAGAMRLEGVELTPLMRAASATSGAYVLQDLLATGAAVDETNALGWTALMLAAAHDNVLGVFTLLQAGAEVNCRDEAGQTARDKAVQAGNTWIARLLAKAEAFGSAKALAETAFPTKQLPDLVTRKSLLPQKEENHSLLTSFALKSAGRLPALRREPGPFRSDRIFGD